MSLITDRPIRRSSSEDREVLLQLQNERHAPSNEPTSLSLAEIEVMPSLFQPRDSLIWQGASRKHIQMMADWLSTQPAQDQKLEPVTIISFGSKWYLLDGHHRIEAYKAAGVETVQTTVVRCSLSGEPRINEAIAISTRLNSKNKLAMDKADKMNSAWRLVLSVGLQSTAHQIATDTHVSIRSVQAMRHVAETLRNSNRHTQDVLFSMSWRAARWAYMRLKKDLPEENISIEERVEREALLLARRLQGHFRDELIARPNVTLRALQIYSPDLVSQLELLIRDQSELEEAMAAIGDL